MTHKRITLSTVSETKKLHKHCPLCLADIVETNNTELECGLAYIDLVCDNGHTWTNEYKLVAYLYEENAD